MTSTEKQGKTYVKNPLTNRSILVGGSVYNKLIREGILSHGEPLNTKEYQVVPKKQKKMRVRKDNVHKYATHISKQVLQKNAEKLAQTSPDDLEKALEKLILQEMTGNTQEQKQGPVYGTGHEDDGEVKKDEPEPKYEPDEIYSSDEYDYSSEEEPAKPKFTPNDFSDSDSDSDSSDEYGY